MPVSRRTPKALAARLYAVMDPHRRGQVPAAELGVLREALGSGLGRVLSGVTLAGLSALALSFAFPRDFVPAPRPGATPR